MRRISVKAVATGGVVDVVATNLLLVPIAVGALARPEVAALPSARQTAAIVEALMTSPSLYTTALLLGSACSVLGGWVAARIAGRDEFLHGALSAFPCVLFSIYALFAHAADVGPWEHAGFLVLTPALGGFGGQIRARQHRRLAPKAVAAVGVDEADARPTLRTWEHVLYVVNRILLTGSALVLLFFVIIGAHGFGTGDRQVVIGAILLSILGFVVFVLYLAAGRALVARRRRHWWLHAGALSLTLLSIFVL